MKRSKHTDKIGKPSGRLLFDEESDQFAHPKNDRGETNGDAPVCKGEWSDIKHLATDGDNQNLSKDDEQGAEKEPFAVPNSVKGRLPCFIRFCIKHVPELKHHKNRKEQGELIVRQPVFNRCEVKEMVEIECQIKLS